MTDRPTAGWVRAGLALALVAGALLLGACTGNHDDATVVRFWTIGHEGEVVQPLLREFERDHPGIRIELQQLPQSAAHAKLLTAFAGDALPDVAQLGNTWLAEFDALGALTPLQQRVAASRVVDRADYFAGAWDGNRLGTNLVGVPWYVDTRLLFYRKDLLAAAGFAAPPRDWDEWRRQMAAIVAQGGDGRYAILLPLNEYEPLLNLAVQQADPLLIDYGSRGNFASPGFRAAFDFYLAMFRNGWAPPMSETQLSSVPQEFANGLFAFYISGPWNVAQFQQRLPAALQDAWGTAPLPGPRGPGAAIGGGSSLVLFAGSTRQQAAWQLVEFLSRPEVQVRFHALSGDLPPRRSAWEAPSLREDRYAQAFRDQLERVVPAPKVPEWERIAQQMRLAAERVVRGGQDEAAALAQLDAEADAILAKRRWLLAREAGQ